MDWAFGLGDGYGHLDNAAEVLHMKELDYEGKKAHVKKLWQEDPKTYNEWKNWCIARNRLPDFFGTRDNPIHIDESKL
jgi:hypothetical protein